ncbi:MAG: quinone-dependent dihydroorotate dehydrogenase [Chloroflexi bacterium]|nr:MAG: quinone-dependent dihydroorotate dehydrogenase [Chloroflexota bacterium]
MAAARGDYIGPTCGGHGLSPASTGIKREESTVIYRAVRPLLFRLDAERAHALTLTLLRWAGSFALARFVLRSLFAYERASLATELFGVSFQNRVGLAAGYDKNGVAVTGLACLGFGHRPRIHRVPEAQALINSMGFPNQGVDALRIPCAPLRVGINIGKGKETPIESAAEDYCFLFERVYRQADYVAINVSSPNTLNLRQLQGRAALEALLTTVTALRDRLTPRRPLLVKIAPDLTQSEIADVLDAITHSGVDGIIATNTTTARTGIPARYAALPGGLSGAPLRGQATAVIRSIAAQTGGRLPIIGVGGVMTPADALEKLDAGAHLVQLYTGLIYSGPGLVRRINQAIHKRVG